LKYLVAASLVVAGLIHLPPLSGVLGADRLVALYGIVVDDPNLAILMRHRAVLLALVGAFLLVAAFVPVLQLAAFLVGFASVLSFLWLAWSSGGYNAAVTRVVAADVVALVSLVIGAVALAWLHARR